MCEKVHQDGYPKENQPDFEQRLKIHVRCRFGKLIRKDAGKCVAGLKERCGNLRRISDDHRDRHRFTKRASKAKNDCAKQPFPGITQNGNSCCLPARRSETVGSFALQVRNASQNFARNRRDNWQNHDRDDDATREHARAVDRAGKEGGPSENALEPWKWIITQPGDHDENAPEPQDHARNRGQHFDQGHQRLPNPQRSKFREVRRRRDTQRNRDQ